MQVTTARSRRGMAAAAGRRLLVRPPVPRSATCGSRPGAAVRAPRNAAVATVLAAWSWRGGSTVPPPRWPGGAARDCHDAKRLRLGAAVRRVALAAERAGIDPAGNDGDGVAVASGKFRSRGGRRRGAARRRRARTVSAARHRRSVRCAGGRPAIDAGKQAVETYQGIMGAPDEREMKPR